MKDFRTKYDAKQVTNPSTLVSLATFEIIDPDLSDRVMETDTEYEVDSISYKEAIKNIIVLSIPSILGLVFEEVIHLVNLMFVGHLDNATALAGVGLGNMLLTMVCFCIAVGLNGGIDTLVSQAFGEREYYLWGCYLNRARIIQLLLFVPQAILLIFTKDLLIYLGQDPESAGAAEEYVILSLPGMFAMSQFETLRRFLQALGNFKLATYIQTTTMLIHIILCYILIFICKLGIAGSALSTSFTYWTNLIVLTFYVNHTPGLFPSNTIHMFNLDSFRHWGQFLKYGVPSVLMMCLEWWCFEVLAIFAGWLSVEELAANIIVVNFIGFLFNFSFGMSYVVGNLVGNSLGENKPNQAKTYAIASMVLIVKCAAIILLIINIFRNQFPLIYTAEPKVVEFVEKTLPVFTLTVFCDYLQGVQSGSIKAIGYQGYGFLICLAGYWAFSVPCAYFLTFLFNLRLVGIWGGVPIGGLFTWISYGIILLTRDWKKLAEEVEDRIRCEKNELSVPLTKL